jgi:hypothetical protein
MWYVAPSLCSLFCSLTSGQAQVVKEHGDGPLPSIVLSCSKELMRVRSMSPQVWPDWFSIGHDDPRLLKHPWHAKVLAWEALGDDTFDLPVAAPPSTGPIPVDLPSPPVHAGNVAGPSTNPTTEYRDKGKGKAVFPDLEAEAEGSRKRKSLMISEPSSQPPKSAMKSHKRTRSTRVVKSKPFVESEDDDQPMIKVCHLGHVFIVSHFFIAVFRWSAGGRPSPALHNYCKDSQFASLTPGSDEATLWPCHSKSHICVRDSGICLQFIRQLPAVARQASNPPGRLPKPRCRHHQSSTQVLFSFPDQ